MDQKELTKLSELFLQMNQLLEKILETQIAVDIERKKWVEAMTMLESGFSGAVEVIANAKGKKMPAFASKAEIDHLLQD